MHKRKIRVTLLLMFCILITACSTEINNNSSFGDNSINTNNISDASIFSSLLSESEAAKSEIYNSNITSIVSSKINSKNSNSQTNNNVKYGEKNSNGTYSFYVSAIYGNDSYSGTRNRQFKTITMATDLAGPGDTIYVSSGTYYETINPISGSAGKPFTIEALKGERPTCTPTQLYNGKWSIHKEKIYVADFSGIDDFINTDTPQLFLNEDSMVEARYPNMGASMSSIMDYKRAIAQNGTNENTIISAEKISSDIKGATLVVWPGDNGVSGWVSFTSPISSSNGYTVKLLNKLNTEETLIGENAYSPVAGNPFYITGALTLLDSPGEYYYDLANKKMYLYTPNGESPSNYRVTVRGNSTYAVYAPDCEYVNIKGVKFYGGGINFKNSNNCKIDECSVRYADHFYGSGYASYSIQSSTVFIGNNNIIKKCEFGPTAGNGITIGGNNNTIIDNIIHDCNYSGNDFAGIFVKKSSELEISENTIYNSARAHIFFDIKQSFGKSIIRNNYLIDHSTLNSDCGAVYTWSCDGGGTEIRNNFVVCGDKNDNGTMDKFIVGLYIDNYSSNFKVHHNIVVGGLAGLQTNLPNINTIFANNTVIGSVHGYALFSVPKDNAEGKTTKFHNNFFVDIKSSDVSYYGTENGISKSYQGKLVNGTAPVPFNQTERIISSNNLRDDIDWKYQPIDGSRAIDGGMILPGITDGYLGAAPDIGAIEKGGTLFKYGTSWSLK